MSSIKATGGPAVNPIVKLPPVPEAPSGPQPEWTTVPNRAPVRPRKSPTAPTKYMLLLTTKHVPEHENCNVWSCFQCVENPPSNRPEHREAVKLVFVAAGKFFAEHGIVLSSLNVCSLKTPNTLELFFRGEGALWAADALAEEFSATFGAGLLRLQENRGKMVVKGIHPMPFIHGVNLDEEYLRALEDLNHVFNSKGERLSYRIRNVHYMSGQLTDQELEKSGCTWSVTFNDFRVAEFFIEEGGFNFLGHEGRRPPRWYENRPLIARRNLQHTAGGGKGAAAVTTGQQNIAKVKDSGAAGPKADEAARAPAGKQRKKSVSKARNQRRKENAGARKEAAESAAGGGERGAKGAVASPAVASAPRQR